MTQTLPIILASASPRRREILSMIGVDFTVDVSDVNEDISCKEPGELVSELAKRKANAVLLSHPEDCVVIGSDTIVWKDGAVLGKPADAEDAARMLRNLSGDTNTVYTGVCIMIRKNGRVTGDAFYEAADVLFAPMSEAEIKAYVATGEPMDKAGAYAVQGIGGRFIRGIHGDFYTVMGLPMCRVYEKLRELQVLTEE